MSIKFDRKLAQSPDGKIKYKIFHKGGREHYNVAIWVNATDDELDQIEKVEYSLHPSFKRRIRKSKDRENKFSITIWTWGMFNIDATVFFRDGTTSKHSYYLSYELPADDGSNYLQVN